MDRLSALNALLNMDEKGSDGMDMDDELEATESEKEVADHPVKNIPLAEKTTGIEQNKSIRQYADAPAERTSLKAKLETMKANFEVFYFYSQLYSQHIIISSVGNKSWVKEHTNGY